MSAQDKASFEDRKKLAQIQKEFDANGHDVYVLNPKDLTALWLARRVTAGADRESAERELGEKAREWDVESLREAPRGTARWAAERTATVLHVRLLTHLAKDLRRGTGSVVRDLRERQFQWNGYHRSPEATVQFWMGVFGARW